MRIMLDQASISLRKVKSNAKITVKDVHEDNISKLIHQDKAFKSLTNLRGSPPYFEMVSRELKAMIRQLGRGTFFITLSAAETTWVHLLKMLGTIVDKKSYSDQDIENLTWQDKCRLIQSDPVTCARHFDFSVAQFMKIMLKAPIMPNVEDYYYRVEFQQRGSPHIHMMIWIKDAPKLGVSSDEEICKFIDSFVSCESETSDPVLNELVNSKQHHRHSHTCKKMNNKKQRRFKFPRYLMPETTILRLFEGEESRIQNKGQVSKYCTQN